ncbi:phospholipase/carboxylesterase family protein [Xylariaceae sp. FL0662B]|nr:phospholipase/carboxylesterase family protein [Xylariaceae sp. FL0662B]
MSLGIYKLSPIDKDSHTHTVIFLHGHHSRASQFAYELLDSRDTRGQSLQHIFPSVKWVFPEARVAGERAGETTPQWFDIWSLSNPDEKPHLQVEGLRESTRRLIALVQAEASQVGGLQNVVLAGISQGGAAAVHVLLNLAAPQVADGQAATGPANDRLGAFVGLSSWMSLAADSAEGACDALGLEGRSPSSTIYRNTPVFLSHSANDGIVPVEQGRKLRDTLVRYGMSVAWTEYERGGHFLYAPRGVDDIVTFLREQGLVRSDISDD